MSCLLLLLLDSAAQYHLSIPGTSRVPGGCSLAYAKQLYSRTGQLVAVPGTHHAFVRTYSTISQLKVYWPRQA